jgi:hypothetical protein
MVVLYGHQYMSDGPCTAVHCTQLPVSTITSISPSTSIFYHPGRNFDNFYIVGIFSGFLTIC